jgi:hypothetical protein
LFLEGQECELSVGVQSCQIAYGVQREWFGKNNLFKIVVKDRLIGKEEYRSERSEENIRFIDYSRNNRIDLFIY